MHTKQVTIVNESAGNQITEAFWYSDAAYEQIVNGIAVSSECYTQDYTLHRDDDSIVREYSKLEKGEEYILRKNNEGQDSEGEMMMKRKVHPLNH